MFGFIKNAITTVRTKRTKWGTFVGSKCIATHKSPRYFAIKKDDYFGGFFTVKFDNESYTKKQIENLITALANCRESKQNEYTFNCFMGKDGWGYFSAKTRKFLSDKVKNSVLKKRI